MLITIIESRWLQFTAIPKETDREKERLSFLSATVIEWANIKIGKANRNKRAHSLAHSLARLICGIGCKNHLRYGWWCLIKAVNNYSIIIFFCSMRHKVVMQYHFLVACDNASTDGSHHINYSAKQISLRANIEWYFFFNFRRRRRCVCIYLYG